MISRYAREKMRKIWSDENKFQAFLKVEILACKAWSNLVVIPEEDVALIEEKAKIDVKRIAEIEQITKHDVIAFTRSISEYLGDERKWVHYGLTSTDVVDTANGYLLKQANDILYEDLISFMDVLAKQAKKYKDIPMGIQYMNELCVTCFFKFPFIRNNIIEIYIIHFVLIGNDLLLFQFYLHILPYYYWFVRLIDNDKN